MGTKTVVLMSGGYESTYCLLHAMRTCRPLAVFFDYGQPYLEQEVAAVNRITDLLNVPVDGINLSHLPCRDGVFENRNAMFIEHAWLKHSPTDLWFGCRGPLPVFDRYGDSNWVFAKRMERTCSDMHIHTPAVMLPKWVIQRRVHDALGECLVYSSEGYQG